ncbi:MAG TPA: BREX system ATP-binding domain-containing protein [Gemmatimonadaceae bacterium]|nr:BREX system ATP-binding domain-containing protein [Gemmatimonadaceae bacterium]
MSDTMETLQRLLTDRYALQREIGRGGMATVYLAQDRRHERPVALKVIHPAIAHTLGVERFLLEIQIAAKLQHSRIVPLYDSGHVGDFPYFVMPFVDGESLRQRMQRERRLPIEEAVRVARDIASALDYAHRQQIIHRDIKPENILLQEGEAVLVDFGIAKALYDATDRTLTQTGSSVGTPSYMSPEQALGGTTVDARADIYSLGVVLYEMLTGETPFTGPTIQAVVARAVSEPVKAVRTFRIDAPEWLDRAILRALAADPARRYETAAAFALALGRRTAGDALTESFAAPTDWTPVAMPRFAGGRGQSAQASAETITPPKPRRSGAQPPPTPLVGRWAERQALEAALDAASRGRGSVHFVVGEGGIGKTRLVTAVAETASARKFLAVAGRAFPVETGIPYALFSDAMLPTIRSLSPAVLQVLTRGSMAELATLFPPLRSEQQPRGTTDDAEIKPRLLDAFGRFLHRLTEREPVLLTLENLHWADPSSLELLHFLARTASGHKLVILCTYDETKRDAHPTLRTIEQSLRSLEVLSAHRLSGLTQTETSELIQRQFGTSADLIADFVTRLHDRTLGNPFFIGETVKTLVASGDLAEDSSRWTGWNATLELPDTVRDAISAQLARLSADARGLAALAAAVGAQIPHALLEAISGLTPDALLRAVDELRAARLVVEVESSDELAYEFRHPMLREVLYTDLSRARARVLHAKIAVALEQIHGDRSLAHAATIAAHFLRAESPALASRSSRYLVTAGRSALQRGANREAAEALETALSVLELSQSTDVAEILNILDHLARAKQRLGDYSRASSLWSTAVTLAHNLGDKRRVAGIERRLGIAAFWSGQSDAAIAHFERGIVAAADDEPRIASLRLARSAVSLESGRADEAAQDIAEAVAIAERVGDPALLSRVHNASQQLAIWRGPAEKAREHGRLALEFATKANDRAAAWNAHWASAVHAGLSGDATGLLGHVKDATAIADELRSPVLRLRTDEVMMEYRTGSGGWEDALSFADRTIADARAFHQRTLLPRLLVWSSLLRFGRGDLETGTAHMQEAWQLSGAERAGSGSRINVHAVVPAHVSRVAWHLAKREWTEALAIAEQGIAIADRTGYLMWAVHRLVPYAAEASLYLRDFERATLYGTRLRNDAKTLGHPLSLAWGDACFAIMRLLKGDPKGAIAPIEAAALALEAIPFIEYAARVRRVLADAYYESGDTESAVKELRRIHETFARLGAIPWLEHVREKFRQLGVRPPARTIEEGVGALTGREVEIARLVAARKSNKEIGAALSISSRTVGTHLSNIFGKLGVDSRGALTDLVREGALEMQREKGA